MTINRKAAVAALALVFLITGAVAYLFDFPGIGPGPLPMEPASNGAPTLTEFGDFNCGHCINFAHTAMPELRRKFINNGSINYVYRHYPFIHSTSEAAAEAAECAREQDAFDPFHDVLFQISAARSTQGEYLQLDDLAAAAEETKLDPERFIRCLSNGRGKTAVLGDQELGRAAGVRGTPALFLDGNPVKWDTYLELEAQIEKAIESR